MRRELAAVRCLRVAAYLPPAAYAPLTQTTISFVPSAPVRLLKFLGKQRRVLPFSPRVPLYRIISILVLVAGCVVHILFPTEAEG